MAADVDDVAQRIRAFFTAEAHVPADDPGFTPDVHLFEAGYLDSIRLVTLLAFLETTFDVKLDDDALFSDQFTTIRGITALVRAAKEGKARVARASADAPHNPAIRPFREADLPAVASLYELVERSGTRNPPPGLEGCFRRMFFDQPHADPGLPSLVHEENGKIEGFLGVHVRRLRLRGRPVRVACLGQLVVEPESRHKAVGMHLLRECLNGPQDLTMTDGATHGVLGMWEALGAHARSTGNVRWTRLLRPWALASDILAQRARGFAPIVRLLGGALASVADLLTRCVTGSRFRAADPAPDLEERELTPEALVERIDLCRGVALLPAYDTGYVSWLFQELEQVRSRGRLRRVLLVERGGTFAGWYVYYRKRGGVSQVLQLVATPSAAQAVFTHLFRDADRGGATAVQGRLEPNLLSALRGMEVSLQHAWSYAVAHTKDPGIAAAIHTGDSLATRLDGEWWCGFQHEPLDEPTRKGAVAATARPPVGAT